MLDTVESFDIQSGPRRFKMWDGDSTYSSEEDKHGEQDFRLPWPTFDMTSVKIPVSWLPKKCIEQYEKRKEKFKMSKS